MDGQTGRFVDVVDTWDASLVDGRLFRKEIGLYMSNLGSYGPNTGKKFIDTIPAFLRTFKRKPMSPHVY
jgi:hypothetical protein